MSPERVVKNSKLAILARKKLMKPMQKLTIPNDRMERLHYVKRMFPQAKGDDLNGEWVGGRSNALYKLHSIDAAAYAKNHDVLDGPVTHLSPYLRYGCLTLSETFEVSCRKSVDAACLA